MCVMLITPTDGNHPYTWASPAHQSPARGNSLYVRRGGVPPDRELALGMAYNRTTSRIRGVLSIMGALKRGSLNGLGAGLIRRV